MKRFLIAAAALTAMAGAAAAQPAFDPSKGDPPSEYPPCTQPGQDRCVVGGHHMAHHVVAHRKGSEGKGGSSGKSSTDGERG